MGVKHKVSELEGAALDLAVSRALGAATEAELFLTSGWFAPSTKWEHGGPIIERERITIVASSRGGDATVEWSAALRPWGTRIDEALPWDGAFPTDRSPDGGRTGPTPLIAAMRAYVASKFGEEVELP